MKLRETPIHYDPVRPLYEEAYQRDDVITMRTIGINTMIAALRSDFRNSSTDHALEYLVDAKKQLETYTESAVEEVSTLHSRDTSRFTDMNRFFNTALFVDESLFLPITFAANTKSARELRKMFTNGTAANALELIEFQLAYIDALQYQSRSESEEDMYAMARGALQENTLTALLNYAQDGSLTVAPSTYYEDTMLSIDARAYYIDADNVSWTAPISFKTSTFAAEREKVAHPGHIVLCGESIGNKHGDISRLLVKEFSGRVALTSDEKRTLEAARLALLADFTAQTGSPEASPIKRLPSRKVIEFVRRQQAA